MKYEEHVTFVAQALTSLKEKELQNEKEINRIAIEFLMDLLFQYRMGIDFKTHQKDILEAIKKIKNIVIVPIQDINLENDVASFFRKQIKKETNGFLTRKDGRYQVSENGEYSCHTTGFCNSITKEIGLLNYDGIDPSTLYHELIHMTEGEESFCLPYYLPYTFEIRKCMSEGRASYYEANITQMKTHFILEEKRIGETPYTYPLYGKLYEIFVTLFGVEAMEAWSKINKKEELQDIPKIEMEFNEIYAILIRLLATDQEKINDIISASIKDIQQKKDWENEKYKNTISRKRNIQVTIATLISDIQNMEENLKNKDNMLPMFKTLLQEQLQEIARAKQEEAPETPWIVEWEEELKTATLEDYIQKYQKELENRKRRLELESKNRAQCEKEEETIIHEERKLTKKEAFLKQSYVILQELKTPLDAYERLIGLVIEKISHIDSDKKSEALEYWYSQLPSKIEKQEKQTVYDVNPNWETSIKKQ